MISKRWESDTAAALAGRRIDAVDAKVSQFPLAMIPIVKRAISDLLRKEEVNLLVCSAACGADLVALDAAFEIGIRCRIVLPFEQSRFRQTSVTDRPGDWGVLFDRIVSLVDSKGDLIVLPDGQNPERAYQHANEVIIREVSAVLNPRRLAILVWEGRPRQRGDATAEFRRLAKAAGMSERIVPTLCNQTSEC
jgi:hypothetical protein